ncbi:MAG: thioredoxin [Oscillospiraceae bacterium]|jgi:thioredoxin 1
MEYSFTKDNFDKEVTNSSIPVMVDFYADWCGPCQMMMPVVKELSDEYDGKVKIGKVNSDEQQELALKFRVMSIPTFLFIKDGKVVDSAVGAMPKSALANKLNSLL